MPSFDTWLDNQDNSWIDADNISAASRAVDAWRRIQDKPTSIVIDRGRSGTIAAQTVRIENTSEFSANVTEVGRTARRRLTVFGIKDHPTETDTDIQKGDKFKVNGLIYQIADVIQPIGEIQAYGETLT